MKELLNEMLFLLLIEANILFIPIIFTIMDGYHFMYCVNRQGSFTVDTTQAHIHMHKAHRVTMVNVLLHTGLNTRRLVEISIYGKSLHSNTRKCIHMMHVHMHTTGEGGESERKKDGGREKERERDRHCFSPSIPV